MYSFILENFDPPHLFVESAAKSASIQWHLKTREIIKSSNLIEIQGLEPNEILKLTIGQHSIHPLGKQEIYQKHREKTREFLCQRNSNGSNQFVITFALNNTQYPNPEKYTFIVNVFIDKQNELGRLTISHIETNKKFNDKTLIISEILDKNRSQIIYAASLYGDADISLIGKEFYVLKLLANGYTSDIISELICLSKHTVDDYRKNLLEKFNAKNTFQLIYHAYQEGFI
jgi:DNA-binding CsgD family transcriptional regulator